MRIADEEAMEQTYVAPTLPTEAPPKPTKQIHGVLDDFNRIEGDNEVITPPKATIDVDEQCALAAQLDEGGLMPT